MIIPVTISLSIQKYLKKLNYFLLDAGDEFECQKRQFHGTFNLFRAGHYKDLTETGNRARKVSGTQGIMTSDTASNYATTQNGRS